MNSCVVHSCCLFKQQLVSLSSVPGNVMEQQFLETISRHMKDKKKTVSSQYGFTKEKSCFTSLIIYDGRLAWQMREAVDIVYLDLSKAFDTVSLKIFDEKLLM